MDVRLINPFIETTQQVFDLMLGLSVKPGEKSAAAHPPELNGALSAMISMSGGANGALVLRFPRDVVNPIVRQLDPNVRTIDDILDAVGELANMICGAAKRKITDQLVEISIPHMSVGVEQAHALAALTPWLTVPFESPLGSFDLAVSFHQSVVFNEKAEGSTPSPFDDAEPQPCIQSND